MVDVQTTKVLDLFIIFATSTLQRYRRHIPYHLSSLHSPSNWPKWLHVGPNSTDGSTRVFPRTYNRESGQLVCYVKLSNRWDIHVFHFSWWTLVDTTTCRMWNKEFGSIIITVVLFIYFIACISSRTDNAIVLWQVPCSGVSHIVCWISIRAWYYGATASYVVLQCDPLYIYCTTDFDR